MNAGFFDFKTISQYVTSFIKKQDSSSFLAGILIGGITATAGFFIYSLYAKKKQSKSSLIEKKEIKVLGQGGNSQCGYHALKNGLISYQIGAFSDQLSFSIHDAEDSRFSDKKYYEELFNNWKNLIIKIRNTNALKIWLQDKLKSYLQQPENPTKNIIITDLIHNEYKAQLNNCGSGLTEDAIDAFENQTDLSSYIINKKIIYSLIRTDDIYNTIINSTQLPNECKSVQEKEKIKKHIENIHLHLKLADNDEIKITQETIDQEFHKNYTSPKLKKAEDLEGDEILALLKHATNFEHIREHFTIVDSIDGLALLENADKAYAAWNNTNLKNSIHIFIVGTMQEGSTSSGHWFTVIAQKVNHQKYIYTMDSMKIDRPDDSRVEKVIQFLESEPQPL
jgi:hypothetical protein